MTKKNTVILLEYLSQYQPMMYDSLCKKFSFFNINEGTVLIQTGLLDVTDDGYMITDEGFDYLADYHLTQEPIKLAREANDISREANKKASRSNIIAWLALFIAGIDLISKLLYK